MDAERMGGVLKGNCGDGDMDINFNFIRPIPAKMGCVLIFKI